MKKDDRITLVCVKNLPNGIVERFEVNVMKDKREQFVRDYESRGYSVSAK